MNLDDCFKHGFLKRIEPDMKNAIRSLDSSEKCLSDAKKNLDIGCHNIVVIVSYTAMFHTTRALLFKDGVKERSHLCIPVYIREKYPNFKRYVSILDSYRIFRHRAIYGLETVIDKADAEEALCSASEFLKTMRGLMTSSRP